MSKLRIYLDTNMVLDIFINQAKGLRNGQIIKPKKFEWMLQNLDKIEFVTSFLTKAEVMRELFSAYTFNEELAEKLWQDFMVTLSCTYVENFTFDDKIVDLVKQTKMKLRTMFNFEHLFIAMHENCYFISGDKDMLKKVKQLNVYEKILTYIELRRMFG